jgi:hypothetical protein
MALPPLELPPIEERVALLPGGPFALWKRWDGMQSIGTEDRGVEQSGFSLVNGGIVAKMVEEQADVAQLVEQLIRNQ